MTGIYFCLFVGWVNYVGHGVCLFVGGMTYVWVILNKHSRLIVFGIFGSPEKDWLLVLKRTGY